MAKAQRRPVRPRDAASLILLRDGLGGLEVLIGRRGEGSRFMPGRYVFPGGRAVPQDARPWLGEKDAPTGGSTGRLLALKRAALRETFEETGLVLGRRASLRALDGNGQALSSLEATYRAEGMMPVLDLLRLVGRAITPTSSPIRFHARFFLADGAHAAGKLTPCDELEDLRWHRVDEAPPDAMQNVTKFMLRAAVEAWRGAAPSLPPLYWHRGERSLVRYARPPR
jgi:8-oxo-dGTP pyrophosphatase MutT (NUDIX family)